jgi:hypothetical protein
MLRLLWEEEKHEIDCEELIFYVTSLSSSSFFCCCCCCCFRKLIDDERERESWEKGWHRLQMTIVMTTTTTTVFDWKVGEREEKSICDDDLMTLDVANWTDCCWVLNLKCFRVLNTRVIFKSVVEFKKLSYTNNFHKPSKQIASEWLLASR